MAENSTQGINDEINISCLIELPILKYHILRFLFEFQIFNINEDECYDNIGI